jgi:hypothetical protein
LIDLGKPHVDASMCSVNVRGPDDQTPLHVAAYMSNDVNGVIDRGASLLAKTATRRMFLVLYF